MAPTKKNPQVLLALIAAAVAILVALIQFRPWEYLASSETEGKPLVLAGTIVDKSSNEGIGQVDITIAGRSERTVTDDSGNFYLELGPDLRKGSRVRLYARKGLYEPADAAVRPPVEDLVLQLQLRGM